jgi:hypothetical protein
MCFFFLVFFFIVVLGGSTLWHLQKFLQRMKHIVLEFSPCTGECVSDFVVDKSSYRKFINTSIIKYNVFHFNKLPHFWITQETTHTHTHTNPINISTYYHTSYNYWLFVEAILQICWEYELYKVSTSERLTLEWDEIVNKPK